MYPDFSAHLAVHANTQDARSDSFYDIVNVLLMALVFMVA